MDPQTAIRKNVDTLTALAEHVPANSLARWLEAYLDLEATTAATSRAVQRQLGHKNAVYAMQDMRVTEEELDDVVNDRSGSG